MVFIGIPEMGFGEDNESAYVNEEPGLKFHRLGIVIYAIELPILFAALVSLTIFLVVLKRSRCFHQPKEFVVVASKSAPAVAKANFALSFLGVIFSRYMIVIPLLISYASNVSVGPVGFCRFAKTLHDSAVYIGALDLVVLIAERTVATVFARVYENKKNTCIGIFFVIFQWIAGFAFVLVNQIFFESTEKSVIYNRLLPCQREYLSRPALQISIGTLLIADVVAIIGISGAFSNRYLSERYQIAENIRTTKLLYPLVITYLLASLIAIGLMACATIGLDTTLKALKENSHQIPLPTKDHPLITASLWGQSFDILVAIYAFMFPCLATYGHHSLWRELIKLTSHKDMRVNPSADAT
ncbi:hypothetical protein L596_002648 [Steinernema carpocapsae]|uniref:G-protein coupled receptors family 1 profile domain-containing protein n=1 Tax=Steinernema carpocapsae TaxID=34508 RepID=A0A4U8USR0_STECR|nr:hypothetical protein L596_002648 [Steinernema carpocapsae]